MDRELQNEREKHDISRLKGFYQILRVKNREKLAKIKHAGSSGSRGGVAGVATPPISLQLAIV